MWVLGLAFFWPTLNDSQIAWSSFSYVRSSTLYSWWFVDSLGRDLKLSLEACELVKSEIYDIIRDIGFFLAFHWFPKLPRTYLYQKYMISSVILPIRMSAGKHGWQIHTYNCYKYTNINKLTTCILKLGNTGKGALYLPAPIENFILGLLCL